MSEVIFPLITIGISCYSAADMIQRAVMGALAQTWANREIIIVDDCSTDDSSNILKDIIRENPDIRLIRHERNSGYPAALNTILKEARGEFVAFFDDDDESAPGRLAAQYARIMAYEEAHGAPLVFCYSNRNVMAPGEMAPRLVRAIGHGPVEPHGPIVADAILGILPRNGFCWGDRAFGSCTLMARRAAFVQVGDFDTQFRRAAEMDYAIRAALLNAHFISVDAPLITQHKTLTGDKSAEIDFKYWRMIHIKHKRYLRRKNVYLGSLAYLRRGFHTRQKHVFRAFFWMIVAFFTLPPHLSLDKIRASSYVRMVRKIEK